MRSVQRDVYGASAHHGLDPSQMCMRLEEFDGEDHSTHERAALRNEIFNGFAEYLFADGPAPEAVRERIEGFLVSFHPDLARAITGEKIWVPQIIVDDVLRAKKYADHLRANQHDATSRGALSVWVRELEAEFDLDTVWETIVGLITFLVSEGKTWKALTAVAYCIAKSLRPQLIASMSLHDIAILSGDAGGRATPSDRGKRLFNRRIAANGGKSTFAHYQKSAATVQKYALAQLGNKNRAKKRKTKTTDPRKK